MTRTLNSELESINSWLNSNKIVMNADKTKYIIFAYRNFIPLDLLKIGYSRIKETESIKFLGVHLVKILALDLTLIIYQRSYLNQWVSLIN